MNRRDFAIGATALTLGASTAQAQARMTVPQRRAARKPPAKYLIVLLHGYGSNGEDMYPLSFNFQQDAPTAAVSVPNAPNPMGGGAFSWMSEAERGKTPGAATQAMATVNAFIDAELAREKLGPDKLILIGFSQGAVMSLNVGLRRAVAPAAIIAFSGGRLDPQGIPHGTARPPVLMIQGDQDDRFAPGTQEATLKILKAAGFPATAHMLGGLGHNIDDRGLKLAGDLLKKVTAA